VRDLGATSQALRQWLDKNEPKAAKASASGRPISGGIALVAADPVAGKVSSSRS
jgi:hypothetical protein